MSYVAPRVILPSITQPPSEATPSYICPLIGDLDMRGASEPPTKIQQAMKLNEILSPSIRQVLKPRKQEPPMWLQRQSANSDFCRALVSNGYMTEAQMQEAVCRYHLGYSRDGGVIFWQIDTLGQICDGKIMYYRPDCHRDHQRHPQWVSNRLKRYYLKDDVELIASIPSYHCLFGTHLLSLADGADYADKIAVVEAEKTAVILSEHYPAYLWLAAGGLFELTAEKLFPLRHHRIVLFPDTDPDLTAYTRWYEVAREARCLYGCNITVSPLLELSATPEQKQRKIDLVDYLFKK